MLVTKILLTIFLIPAYWLVMRYNLHMFQLNGYSEKEHYKWFKEKHGKQRSLVFLLIFAILNSILHGFGYYFTFVFYLINTLIVVWYFSYMRKWNTKKNLVYTRRVQRMIGIDVAISIIIAIFFISLGGFKTLPGILGILTVCQILIFPIANRILKPFETLLKKRYITEAEELLKSHPNLKIIGVTGSYGKTSLKFYLQTLLSEKYNVLVTPESYNTPMGVVMTIRGSLRGTHDIFICEMGAKKVGEIKEICDFVHPDYGLITSIGPAHLDTFLSIDNILKTKLELADALPEEGKIFLNGDNEYLQNNTSEYKNKIFYRNNSKGDGYYTEKVRVSSKGTAFTVVNPKGEKEEFHTSLVGEHNIINIVGAIALANTMGIPLKNLKIPVKRIKAASHRMEILEKGNVTIIDDAYNSNPVGSKAAVQTLKMFDGIRILITPGMVELGNEEYDYNYKFGTYSAECCDYIILIGKKHTKPIYAGAVDKGFPKEKIKVFEHFKEGFEEANRIHGNGHKYILIENDLPDNY